LQNWWC